MSAVLNLGLDLGSDTLKVAYAFRSSGKVYYGKIISDESSSDRTAMPAVAFYDEGERRWLYGDEIGKGSEGSFITVVKIKNLLSLLEYRDDEELTKSNSKYYFEKHQFPKFYFPVRREFLEDFRLMEQNDRTFSAAETPKQVCAAYFCHVRDVVFKRIKELSRVSGVDFSDNFRLAAVLPPSAGAAYSKELSSLIRDAFGHAPDKIFSSTKALSMFARRAEILSENEELLLFDMGEEQISVTKAFMRGGTILTDGKDGHSDPFSLGGKDIDERICAYLEENISERETMGTPSFGEEGHIREIGLHSKQYLLMKDIKRAKAILSRPLRQNSVFSSGVPVSICRDLYIQRKLTQKQLVKIIGVSGEKEGLAERIVDYISQEIALPLNRNVRKVFLSGGLVETFGLLDYIKTRLKRLAPSVTVHDYNGGAERDDGYSILSNEDSVYAASVGAAYAALYNEHVETAVSYSYGTWFTMKGRPSGERFLKILVNRGQALTSKNVFSGNFSTSNAYCVEGEELFSTLITDAEIAQEKYKGYVDYVTADDGQHCLNVGVSDSDARRKAIQTIDLKTVAGGKDGGIYFMYRGLNVKLEESTVHYSEGIKISPDGRAEPFLQNISSNEFIQIRYIDTELNRKKGYPFIGTMARVPADQIEIRFMGVNDSFKVAVAR